MNILVATSEHGYSIYDQSKNIEKLKRVKQRCEKLQDDIPAADGSRIKFVLVPEGAVPSIPGKSFLQSLKSYCSEPECLEEKIQSESFGVT